MYIVDQVILLTIVQIKYALESVQGIGKITVTEWPFLGIDRYQTGCPGRLIYVEFEDLAGDQPMITVEGGGLSGDDVHVTVGEVLPGGMMAHPIPGHMLQTVERTPQVRGRHTVAYTITSSIVCYVSLTFIRFT